MSAKADGEGLGCRKGFGGGGVFEDEAEDGEGKLGVEGASVRPMRVVQEVGCEGEEGGERRFLAFGGRGKGEEDIYEERVRGCEIVG